MELVPTISNIMSNLTFEQWVIAYPTFCPLCTGSAVDAKGEECRLCRGSNRCPRCMNDLNDDTVCDHCKYTPESEKPPKPKPVQLEDFCDMMKWWQDETIIALNRITARSPLNADVNGSFHCAIRSETDVHQLMFHVGLPERAFADTLEQSELMLQNINVETQEQREQILYMFIHTSLVFACRVFAHIVMSRKQIKPTEEYQSGIARISNGLFSKIREYFIQEDDAPKILMLHKDIKA